MEGWVVSLPIGFEDLQINDENSEASVDYHQWYIGPRIGYLWHPLASKRLYLIGEAVALIPFATSGRVQLGEGEVEMRSFFPIPQIGIGYRF